MSERREEEERRMQRGQEMNGRLSQIAQAGTSGQQPRPCTGTAKEQQLLPQEATAGDKASTLSHL